MQQFFSFLPQAPPPGFSLASILRNCTGCLSFYVHLTRELDGCWWRMWLGFNSIRLDSNPVQLMLSTRFACQCNNFFLNYLCLNFCVNLRYWTQCYNTRFTWNTAGSGAIVLCPHVRTCAMRFMGDTVGLIIDQFRSILKWKSIRVVAAAVIERLWVDLMAKQLFLIPRPWGGGGVGGLIGETLPLNKNNTTRHLRISGDKREITKRRYTTDWWSCEQNPRF